MSQVLPLFALALAAGFASQGDPPLAAADTDLASRAVGILRQYCFRCHGLEFKVPGYDVLNRAKLVAGREDENPYISPGKLDESELWTRFDEMPPKGKKPSPQRKGR